jgi:predicted ThiF/HesA family dinucleotide-utilizing enzyme
MYWNETTRKFIDDDSCSFSLIYDDIPCLTCAESETINTTVAMCRCVHLSRFAAAY